MFSGGQLRPADCRIRFSNFSQKPHRSLVSVLTFAWRHRVQRGQERTPCLRITWACLVFGKDSGYVVAKKDSTNERLRYVSRPSAFLFDQRKMVRIEHRIIIKNRDYSHSELRVGAQAVELLGRVLFSTCGCCLPETRRDFVERPALGLWHFEVGEDEEQEQQHGEDDEDIRATQLLWRGVTEKERERESKRKTESC